MGALVIKSFILSFLISYSSAYLLNEFKTQFLWKVNFALIPVLGNPSLFVDAVPPPEEVAKLKEKIKKGKVLLEELNESLEKIKENLKEKKEVEKETLDKIVEIKDNFQKLEVDPSDLSKDIIEDFKIKVVEAFKLIMESYGLDKASLKKKASKIKKEEKQTTEEVMAEDTTTTTMEEPVVDNKVEKPFLEEL